MALMPPTGDNLGAQPGAPFNPQQMMQMMQMMHYADDAARGRSRPLGPTFCGAPGYGRRPGRGFGSRICEALQAGKLIREQDALPFQPVLIRLCLKPDGTPLRGIPKGCTIAFAGPPGKGKTRSCLEGLLRVAASGVPCLFVVAEEGFLDEGDSDAIHGFAHGQDWLRRASLGEDELKEKVLVNVWVMQAQYHKGQSWDDFIHRYRYVVERHKIRTVVIDSLNMPDPAKTRYRRPPECLKDLQSRARGDLRDHRSDSRYRHAGGRRGSHAHR